MKPKLLISFRPLENVRVEAERDFDLITEGDAPLKAARAVELANKHQVAAMMIPVAQNYSAADIAALPSTVKIVATSSVGYDHIDVAAFAKRGIVTSNTPDVLTAATADMAMLLMLATSRRLREHVAIVEKGWGQKLGQADWLGLDLNGKTLGILGMGRIGQAMAVRAQAFGMKILYNNRRRLPADQEHGAIFVADFHEMLPQCQVLSLHAPAVKETDKIMNAEALSRLPQDAIFINVARGSLVDEDALFNALDSKRLFAAGLDVCATEPNPDPRFKNYANVLLTPHVASATRETRDSMGFRALENIRAVLGGEKARDALS